MYNLDTDIESKRPYLARKICFITKMHQPIHHWLRKLSSPDLAPSEFLLFFI